jgi:pyruvate kinase
VPIIALASSDPTLRLLNVLRGTWPVKVAEDSDSEQQLAEADRYLLASGSANAGDVVVMVAAIPLGEGRETNTIRFHRVRE